MLLPSCLETRCHVLFRRRELYLSSIALLHLGSSRVSWTFCGSPVEQSFHTWPLHHEVSWAWQYHFAILSLVKKQPFCWIISWRGSSDEVCGSLATPDPVFGTEDPLVAGAGAEDAVADTLSSPRGDKLEVGAEAWLVAVSASDRAPDPVKRSGWDRVLVVV